MGYPYGLTDVKVFPLTGDTPGTAVSLPAGRTVEVDPTEDEVSLTGYNGVVASDVTNTAADVTVEHGGVSLAFLAAVTGQTIVSSGTTPNVINKLKVGSAGVARPYVRVIGKALDGNGDVWIDVKKVKFNLPKGAFQEGAYYISNLTGKAVRNGSGDLMEFLEHETATTIVAA